MTERFAGRTLASDRERGIVSDGNSGPKENVDVGRQT